MFDTRVDWDTYHLGVADAVAKRADCTRRLVGCVLVDDEHRVLSTGYNGAPPGQPGCLSAGACERGKRDYDEILAGSSYSNCISLHAEMNAVGDAARRGVAIKGATAYITDAPCYMCVKVLQAAGVVAAVWPGGRLTLLEGVSTP